MEHGFVPSLYGHYCIDTSKDCNEINLMLQQIRKMHRITDELHKNKNNGYGERTTTNTCRQQQLRNCAKV